MNELHSAWKEKHVGKQKFELIWKMISINQISSYVIKMPKCCQSKKARLLKTERFIELWQADGLE